MKDGIHIDGFVGLLVGYFLLHPASMIVVSASVEGDLSLIVSWDEMVQSVMGFYFALIGLLFGLISGMFRMRLKRKNDVLRQQKTELERVDTEKDSLLRILTHDTANSLVSATGFLKLVVEGKYRGDEESLREELAEVYHSLRETEELVRFSRTLMALESGKISIPLTPHDLRPLVDEASNLLARKARDKKVHLRVRTSDEPVYARVEPVTFKNTVLGNVIDNAIKFSRRGEEVVVAVEVRDGDAAVSVKNLGPVIPPEKRKRLFSPSEETSTTGTGGETGTGFGLPLTRRYVEMMNGKVEVSSDFLGDSTWGWTLFTVRLPRTDAEGEPL